MNMLEKQKNGLCRLKQLPNFGIQTEEEIYDWREKKELIPVYKIVDTCAAEFESETPYYYGTYEEENESKETDKKSVIVLGLVQFGLVKGLSLIMQLFILYGRLKKLDMKHYY